MYPKDCIILTIPKVFFQNLTLTENNNTKHTEAKHKVKFYLPDIFVQNVFSSVVEFNNTS